jgi:hypothetical protein
MRSLDVHLAVGAVSVWFNLDTRDERFGVDLQFNVPGYTLGVYADTWGGA